MGKTWYIKGMRVIGGTQSLVTIATVHELEYHAEWMGDEYVTVTVKTPTPIDFHFGDYLVYRSEYFRINYDPNVVKKAALGKYGEGFTYDNIKLYSDASKTKDIDFKDVVLSDNQIAYTSLGTFSFYCASVEDLADRLQANLDRNASGVWKVLTPSWSRTSERVQSVTSSEWQEYYNGTEDTGETDVNIDIDNQKCSEVLKYAYERFGLAYYFRGTTIVIGGASVVADHIFRYGKNNGLYEVERTSDENQEIVTRLFAYGSEQNLPLNYYANLGRMMYIPGERDAKTADNVTTYALNTNVVLYAVQPAVKSGAVLTLRYGNDTVGATLEGRTDQYGTYAYLKFVKDGSGSDESFYNALGTGVKTVYVSGADINLWPATLITEDQSYDYPSALSVNRLMLPGFPEKSLDRWVQDKIASTTGEEREQWEYVYEKYTFSQDKDDPWVMSKNASAIGIKEGTVNYDGSQQKEIYPTIAGTASSHVHSATQITDNGYLTDGQDITFHLYMNRGDGLLDWEDALKNALDTVYVEMTSGYCTGRRFKVNGATAAEKDGDEVYDLTCEREKDTSLERYFPYYDNNSGYCQVQEGDTFVVTGIQMPDLYVEQAAERLLIASCGYLDRRDHMRYTYIPKVDEIYMQRQDDYIKSGATDKPLIYGTASYHDTLHAGMQMEFEDTDLGIWHSPYIDQLTIKENGNNGIPTYEVVLRDEKEKGTLEKLAERISDLQHPVIAPTERQTRQSRNAEYPEWVQGQAYYYQTLNPVPFEGVVYIETSYVWHRGCLWMCLRTLTAQEPWFTSADWVCLRANNISLGFYSNEIPPIPLLGLSVRPQHIDETVVPYLLLGQEDISKLVTSWQWERETQFPELDLAWKNSARTVPGDPTSPLKSVTRTLHITFDGNSQYNDLPNGWDSNGGSASFKCTATFPFDGDMAEIINSITIT